MRQVTNITSSDISDTQLATLIEFAGVQLNNDMNMYVEDEQVAYMDPIKANTQDGVNSTYYTQYAPIGDKNNDFRVTTTDLEVWEVDNSAGTKTQLTVTQINSYTGEFHLSTAPTSDKKLLLRYMKTQRRVDSDRLVKMACIMLTAAWGYSKLNIGKATRFHMGNLTVFRDTDAYHKYYIKYCQLLAQINDRSSVSSMDYNEGDLI